MVRSLYSAATGMRAQQTNIDNTANNLANVNTAGFKKGRVVFEDLMYQQLRSAGSLTAAGITHPTGIQLGLGVNTVAIEKIFEQGSFQYTSNVLDMAIENEGFFQVLLQDGTIGYTRQGIFKKDANGDVVTSQGYYLEPNINIPEGVVELNIGVDGTVTGYMQNDDEPMNLGQITLARFINPSGLKALGENTYIATGASGAPMEGIAGEDNFGKIKQFFIEMSNVSVVDEMVNMITAQRAYEMDSKAIQTSDEMLQIANGLKR